MKKENFLKITNKLQYFSILYYNFKIKKSEKIIYNLVKLLDNMMEG